MIVSGPAISVKRPMATMSTDGIAKNELYASAEASIIALFAMNLLPAPTRIAFQSAKEGSRSAHRRVGNGSVPREFGCARW